MSAEYELWDLDSRNVVAFFTSEEEALTSIAAWWPDTPEEELASLALFTDEHGVVAEGVALIRKARESA